MIKINSHSNGVELLHALRKPRFNYTNLGAMVHGWLVYLYFSNVPSICNRYFNKIKPTFHLGKQPALSLEILLDSVFPRDHKTSIDMISQSKMNGIRKRRRDRRKTWTSSNKSLPWTNIKFLLQNYTAGSTQTQPL